MLKIIDNPTFSHPVTARVPVDGGYREDSFRATFRVLPTPEMAKHNLDTVEGITGCLKALIVKLDELEDGDGKPLPYSDAVRDQVIAIPYVSKALFAAYLAGLQGAALGN